MCNPLEYHVNINLTKNKRNKMEAKVTAFLLSWDASSSLRPGVKGHRRVKVTVGVAQARRGQSMALRRIPAGSDSGFTGTHVGGLARQAAAAGAGGCWRMIPTRAAARNPAPDKSELSAVFFCHQ